MTELNGEPVYIIEGIKDEEFLGIIPVKISIETTASATDGRLIDITQGFFTRILDIISF